MAITVYTNDAAAVEERVRAIITVDDDADLDEVIDSALMLVEGLASPAGYSQTDMERLHAWLAAHFYEVNIQRYFEQWIGRAKDKPETKVDLGLQLTRPGQQVLVLDWRKAFSPIADDTASFRKARMFWAGNPRTEFP